MSVTTSTAAPFSLAGPC